MATTPSIKTLKGYPQPYGVSAREEGVNFALFSKNARSVTLFLFRPEEPTTPFLKIPYNPQIHKTGDIWHILIQSLPENLCYAYQIEGSTPAEPQDRFDSQKFLLDPYAKAIHTSKNWGKTLGPSYFPLGKIILDDSFDWEDDKPLRLPLKDLILYEMHVRGFTQHPSSKVKAKGKFLGIIEKIPYLLDLGINAVELLPIHEFNEGEYKIVNPQTQDPLYNYWGYSTVNFFSPMNRYVTSDTFSASIVEFKTLMKELHRHGIELILDVVYNHTAEGNEKGPTYSFKGIENSVYYLLGPHGEYLNYTGCGNTLNCNHPVVIELILNSLRYWVNEMHVDGFRFDLASIFSRNIEGHPIGVSPLIEAISQDPLLAKTKLIAEPWDAVGLYQVGSFYPKGVRWGEWNGKYRDAVRQFIKGNFGSKGKFATRLSGSQDLYSQRSPLCSYNFVTVHDGFTLVDLVSYNYKHNVANGEDNRDGNSNNDSWNCGHEGATTNVKILALRERQMRNFHLALMTSQGVPMLLMGDEYGHTRDGNNNTWCQDNELNWFLWDHLITNRAFFEFYKKLIHFRQSHALLRQGKFLTDQDVQWHGFVPFQPHWEKNQSFLAFTLLDQVNHADLYVAFNAQNILATVEIPLCTKQKSWHWIVQTANLAPYDFYDQPLKLEELKIKMLPHSALLLKAI